MITLSNRVHIFAHPQDKDRLTEFFVDILDCEATPLPGTSITLFRFPNTSMTVDFTEDALDQQQARRGAWLEVKSDDPAALKKKVLAAGLPQIVYPTGRFYFQAPGGQIWGIVEP